MTLIAVNVLPINFCGSTAYFFFAEIIGFLEPALLVKIFLQYSFTFLILKLLAIILVAY